VSKRLELWCRKYQPEACALQRSCSPHGYARPMSCASSQPAEEQRVLAAEDEYVAAEASCDEATLRRPTLDGR
jgi:hypothetical protein